MKNKTLVMIPGPTPVIQPLRNAMAKEIQAFGDPRFVKDYKELIDDLHNLYNCDGKTFIIAGTGTTGMEMALANVTKKDDDILIISHGFFGDRFIDIANCKDLKVDLLQAKWGERIAIDDIKEKLDSKKYAAVTITHVDTSTGVASDIKAVSELMKNYPETIFIVDGICSVGAYAYDIKDLGIDILITGSQKAFGVSPGLFMLWASDKALKRRQSFTKINEYYVDFERWIPIMDDPSKYFATPAVNLVWSLKESVALIKEEGLNNREQRHTKIAQAAQKAYEALGFKILAVPDARAITLSNLIYPSGLDDVKFRADILDEGGIVAGGLGEYAGKMCRIGHMGNIDENDVITAIGIVERALVKSNSNHQIGKGVTTFLEEISK
jgi:aspartate aminotransferase-like enzyme